jgi:hypothetical protein
VQFILKGLAGVGTRAAGDSGDKARDFLQQITGFEERNSYE